MKAITYAQATALFCSTLYLASSPAIAMDRNEARHIDHIVQNMSLREKIGQKLMLDFRYWCDQGSSDECKNNFTQMNPTVADIIRRNHIGGIILFANNIASLQQTKALTDAAQKSVEDRQPLLITTDQEGGIVSRLPASQTVTFSGNMAIGAAYLGNNKINYAKKVGRALAEQLKYVGINVNNAPDVDVNINPKNPVIHVRSFSDSPELVAKLGQQMVSGIQRQGVAATLKHFPGHGDTSTDSHTGLPHVDHSWAQAWSIDLYPFQQILQSKPGPHYPDMVMTAHIQFPELDNSQIWADKKSEWITVPATLSRKIQHDILRGKGNIFDNKGHNPHQGLAFKGVSITDALDMGAISENFTPTTAVINAFKAGNDIALMPVSIYTPSAESNLKELINNIVAAVRSGAISRQELNQSVRRIVALKEKLGSFPESDSSLQNIKKRHKKLSQQLANDSITLVKNESLLPILPPPSYKVHILTPWGEQGDAIKQEIIRLQNKGEIPKGLEVTTAKISTTTEKEQKKAINEANLVIIGGLAKGSEPLSTMVLQQNKLNQVNHQPSVSPVVFPEMPMGDSPNLHSISSPILLLSKNAISDDQFAFDMLKYAHENGKKTVFISVLSPYDLPNFSEYADAMLVAYDYYGYLPATSTEPGYFRGPAMQAIARTLFSNIRSGYPINSPSGLLPVNVPNPKRLNNIIYPRTSGLNY